MLVLGPSRYWRRCSPGTHTYTQTLGLTCRPAQVGVGGPCSSGRGLTSTREELHSRALTATRAERSTSARGHTKRTHLAPSAQSWTHTHRLLNRTVPPLATLQNYTGGALLLPGCTAPCGVHAGEGRLLLSGQSAPDPAPGSAPSPLLPPPSPLGSAIWKVFFLALRRCDWPTVDMWDDCDWPGLP